MTQTETIPEYLDRVRRKEIEKHGGPGGGWRTTREVADFYDIPLATARRRLNRLYESGTIDAAQEGAALVWRSKET